MVLSPPKPFLLVQRHVIKKTGQETLNNLLKKFCGRR